MGSGGYPQYLVGELESIAAQILKQRFPGGLLIPIDVDYIVETEPRVSLDLVPGLRDHCGVAGCVVAHPEEGRFSVLIDSGVADGAAAFYRFTLAEELGHLALHRDVLREVKTLADVVKLHSSDAYYSVLDRNAKRLASCILMPTDGLKKDAENIFVELRDKNLPEAALVKALTIRLSQRYHVSVSAMEIRLTNWPLGIYRRIAVAVANGLHELP